MSVNIPLYDQLLSQLDNKNIKTINKKHASSIARLPQEHINIIYILILHYYMKNNSNTTFDVPYGGKTSSSGKGVTFKLNNLPETLQSMIVKYMDIISSS